MKTREIKDTFFKYFADGSSVEIKSICKATCYETELKRGKPSRAAMFVQNFAVSTVPGQEDEMIFDNHNN